MHTYVYIKPYNNITIHKVLCINKMRRLGYIISNIFEMTLDTTGVL